MLTIPALCVMVIPVNVAALARVVDTSPSEVLTAAGEDTEMKRFAVLIPTAGVVVTSELGEGPCRLNM